MLDNLVRTRNTWKVGRRDTQKNYNQILDQMGKQEMAYNSQEKWKIITIHSGKDQMCDISKEVEENQVKVQ